MCQTGSCSPSAECACSQQTWPCLMCQTDTGNSERACKCGAMLTSNVNGAAFACPFCGDKGGKDSTGSSLPQKLAAIDRQGDKTKAFIHGFLDEYWEEIGTLAKGRLVTGHFVWGDRNFKEWGPERLLKELIEELADARNYASERFVKLDGE